MTLAFVSIGTHLHPATSFGLRKDHVLVTLFPLQILVDNETLDNMYVNLATVL